MTNLLNQYGSAWADVSMGGGLQCLEFREGIFSRRLCISKKFGCGGVLVAALVKNRDIYR